MKPRQKSSKKRSSERVRQFRGQEQIITSQLFSANVSHGLPTANSNSDLASSKEYTMELPRKPHKSSTERVRAFRARKKRLISSIFFDIASHESQTEALRGDSEHSKECQSHLRVKLPSKKAPQKSTERVRKFRARQKNLLKQRSSPVVAEMNLSTARPSSKRKSSTQRVREWRARKRKLIAQSSLPKSIRQKLKAYSEISITEQSTTFNTNAVTTFQSVSTPSDNVVVSEVSDVESSFLKSEVLSHKGCALSSSAISKFKPNLETSPVAVLTNSLLDSHSSTFQVVSHVIPTPSSVLESSSKIIEAEMDHKNEIIPVTITNNNDTIQSPETENRSIALLSPIVKIETDFNEEINSDAVPDKILTSPTHQIENSFHDSSVFVDNSSTAILTTIKTELESDDEGPSKKNLLDDDPVSQKDCLSTFPTIFVDSSNTIKAECDETYEIEPATIMMNRDSTIIPNTYSPSNFESKPIALYVNSSTPTAAKDEIDADSLNEAQLNETNNVSSPSHVWLAASDDIIVRSPASKIENDSSWKFCESKKSAKYNTQHVGEYRERIRVKKCTQEKRECVVLYRNKFLATQSQDLISTVNESPAYPENVTLLSSMSNGISLSKVSEPITRMVERCPQDVKKFEKPLNLPNPMRISSSSNARSKQKNVSCFRSSTFADHSSDNSNISCLLPIPMENTLQCSSSTAVKVLPDSLLELGLNKNSQHPTEYRDRLRTLRSIRKPPKSGAQRSREYRERQKIKLLTSLYVDNPTSDASIPLSDFSSKIPSRKIPKSCAQLCREYRARKKEKMFTSLLSDLASVRNALSPAPTAVLENSSPTSGLHPVAKLSDPISGRHIIQERQKLCDKRIKNVRRIQEQQTSNKCRISQSSPPLNVSSNGFPALVENVCNTSESSSFEVYPLSALQPNTIMENKNNMIIPETYLPSSFESKPPASFMNSSTISVRDEIEIVPLDESQLDKSNNSSSPSQVWLTASDDFIISSPPSEIKVENDPSMKFYESKKSAKYNTQHVGEYRERIRVKKCTQEKRECVALYRSKFFATQSQDLISTVNELPASLLSSVSNEISLSRVFEPITKTIEKSIQNVGKSEEHSHLPNPLRISSNSNAQPKQENLSCHRNSSFAVHSSDDSNVSGLLLPPVENILNCSSSINVEIPPAIVLESRLNNKSTQRPTEYRDRSYTLRPSRKPPKSGAQRSREYRERQKEKRLASLYVNSPTSDDNISTSPSKSAWDLSSKIPVSCDERSEKWKEYPFALKSFRKSPKNSAQRSREYRARKKNDMLTSLLSDPNINSNSFLSTIRSALTSAATTVIENSPLTDSNSTAKISDSVSIRRVIQESPKLCDEPIKNVTQPTHGGLTVDTILTSQSPPFNASSNESSASADNFFESPSVEVYPLNTLHENRTSCVESVQRFIDRKDGVNYQRSSRKPAKSAAERQKNYRARKKMFKLASSVSVVYDQESPTEASSDEVPLISTSPTLSSTLFEVDIHPLAALQLGSVTTDANDEFVKTCVEHLKKLTMPMKKFAKSGAQRQREWRARKKSFPPKNSRSADTVSDLSTDVSIVFEKAKTKNRFLKKFAKSEFQDKLEEKITKNSTKRQRE